MREVFGKGEAAVSEDMTMYIDDDTTLFFAKSMMERLERRFPEKTREQLAERWFDPVLVMRLREDGYLD